jgi:hypothetical protein
MAIFRRRIVFACALLGGCVAPPLESPPMGGTCNPTLEYSEVKRDKVDILFMVDNSASMEAMSMELRARFDQFLKVFSDLAAGGTYADLQIGVVTSDFGAGQGSNGCQASPGGQSGKLQAIGVAADQSCKAPQGANFIKYAYTADGTNPNNLPQGQDLNTTFTCMASVGTQGCGFEAQLESVYAALHNNIPENVGFLRDDAILAVVFLTNEDDASAPPDTDVFGKDPSLVPEYGYLDSFSRQTRFAIVCGPDPGELPPYGDSMGPLSNCHAAPNLNGAGPGKEYDISRYIQFFSKPAIAGGVKASPQDVILVGIDAPSDPFQVILSNPGTAAGQPYMTCPTLDEKSNPPCVPVLQHSCQNTAQPGFFGDPAVRLNQVINSVAQHSISSICDADYTGALQKVGDLITSNLLPGCFKTMLPDQPDCVVEDVTTMDDGTTQVSVIPKCSDPQSVWPCWTLDVKEDCSKVSPQSLGFTIQRNGAPVPAHTNARVVCSTTCQ